MKKTLLFITLSVLTIHSQAQTVTDLDGNIYNTVTIGTQTWMKENLRTSKYNDGTSIPLFFVVNNTTDWGDLKEPAYCWYNNDSTTFKATYGALYNGYAENTGKLCPEGWHVPTDSEWLILINYLGGQEIAGKNLKESGNIHWYLINTDADNSSGFTALPGGNVGYCFVNIGLSTVWWSSTYDGDGENYWCYSVNNKDNVVSRYIPDYGFPGSQLGFSVRCLCDKAASSITNNDIYENYIYPNPSKDKLYFHNIISSNSVINILNIQGEILLKNHYFSNPLDISNLKNGIYFIKIIDSGNIKTIKFIKE